MITELLGMTSLLLKIDTWVSMCTQPAAAEQTSHDNHDNHTSSSGVRITTFVQSSLVIRWREEETSVHSVQVITLV